MTRVVLVSPSIAFEHRLRRALGDGLRGSVSRYDTGPIESDALQAMKEIVASAPDLVVIGPNVANATTLDLAGQIESEHPEIGVVAVTEPTPDMWKLALRAGVADVISPQSSSEDLAVSLERVFEIAARRRYNIGTANGTQTTGARVITVLAPKGGVGKTTFATNLAVALAERATTPIALLDLDLTFGDVASTLGLTPMHTMSDLLTVPGGISATALKMFLTPRDGLFTLCAPESPEAGELVTEAIVTRVLRLMADEFSHVVVDTSAGLSNATLAAAEASTDLMFMCDLSLSALKALRKLIDTLDQLALSAPTRHLVLNRADAKVGIEPEQAAALVGLSTETLIPVTDTIPVAMNAGIPVVEHAPRSPAAKRFRAATELFLERVEPPRRTSLLRRNR